TGGMAAVSITFARYFLELTRAAAPEWLVATAALAILTIINCLGVKIGGRTQSVLMVLKIVAIAALVAIGIFGPRPSEVAAAALPAHDSFTDFGAALVPVLFAYGGWQTANFVAGGVRDPRSGLLCAMMACVCG